MNYSDVHFFLFQLFIKLFILAHALNPYPYGFYHVNLQILGLYIIVSNIVLQSIMTTIYIRILSVNAFVKLLLSDFFCIVTIVYSLYYVLFECHPHNVCNGNCR